MAKRPRTTLTVGARTWEQYSADCWVSNDGVLAFRCGGRAHYGMEIITDADRWFMELPDGYQTAPASTDFSDAATRLATYLDAYIATEGPFGHLIEGAKSKARAHCNGDLPW